MTRRPHVELRRGRVGPDGRRLCCHCDDPVPKGRRDWCGDPCVVRYQVAKGDQGAARRAVWDRDKGVCALCGTRCRPEPRAYVWDEKRGRYVPPHNGTTPWEADHAVPICEGGALALHNLRTLCRPCHRRVTRELRARLAAAKIVNEVDARGRLLESVRKAREENEKSRGLLAEVAGSGVELQDDRMRYLVVQIGRDLWAKVTEASKP